jgi:PAS domain S-box-containing protein
MKTKIEQFPATNPNPVLSVEKDGTVLYSNEAGEPLLHKWGVEVGEKLSSYIGDFVQRVISRNIPEKMEVKVGKKVYLIAFHPLPEEGHVNIYGFDISGQKDLERKLRESEEDLAEVQKMAHIGNWKWNIVTNELRWSDEVYRIFGLNPQEFEATFDAYFNYVHPDDRDRLDNALKKAFKGEPYSIDNQIITANGEERIFHTDAEFTFNEDNIPVYARGIVQDITERKKAEKALQESEERFRSAFDDSAVAMALVDPDARLLKVNDAFCRLLGFEKSEIEGHKFLDFTHSNDMKPSELAHKAVISGEKPLLWIEKRYIRKDGRVIWCEVSSSPVLDSKGCPIYTVAHVQDITERKQMEDSLRQSQALLSAVLEQLPVGLGLADTQGRWLVTNNMLRRFISGGVIPSHDPENSWRWRTWGVDGCLLEQTEWPNAKALQGENIIAGLDFLYTSDEGREIWTRISSVPFRNEAGEITGTISVIQDIDEQKRTEEALEKIEKTRIKEIHHRIKNNLQVISSLLSLQAEKFSDTKILEALRESQNRVASMALIHEELYEGDKIDTFDFAAYIHKLTSHLFSSYNVKNDNVSLKLDIGQIYLNMDPAIPLGIIVNELVSNALKHAFPAGSEGEIYISLSKAKTPATKHDISDSGPCYMEKNSFNYVLTVADNGKGIPEEIEFQNADSLGLQLVNILVEQIDGCMELKRNHGTEFIIWFNNIDK